MCQACAASAAMAAPWTALAGEDSSAVWVHEARHWKALANKQIECQLCPRRCRVADRERGYCGVRENRDGKYHTLVYGRPVSVHVDPIEKKPLFHFLPGSNAFSLATVGCNIECRFCQNWQISQFRPEQVRGAVLPPQETARLAQKRGARSIAYTYSEPVIFYEYMHDTAVQANALGVKSVMISNGYIEPEPMRQVAEHLAAVKIDLKAFTEAFYRELCSGRLEPVLETLKLLAKLGKWIEIVVLILPTKNDSPEEIKRMSEWIRTNLGKDVPLHFTRFHPTYKVRNLPRTPLATLKRCHRIATDAGLRYVYVGNVIGDAAEHTYCPKCRTPVVERIGFTVLAKRLAHGKCAKCGQPIAGVWK
jgi:pyruvate formate lyase activating enzyme